MKRPATFSGDLRGGLVGAAVVLPQASAFGMTVFAPYLGTAPGALAGLIGAIGLLAIAGFIGGTAGLISGPTGATMALLAGTAAVLATAGLDPEAIASALFIVTAFAGLSQLLIALAGGARLMKFIPYPVIAGLTTGTGLLLIKSQYPFLLGIDHQAPLSRWHWLPVATAAGTFLIARFFPRRLPRFPGPIAGLIGGTALFQLLMHTAGPEIAPPHWVIGAMPAFSEFRPAFQTLAQSAALPWPLILQAAFTLAVLASLNTLLTSAVADTATGLRHDPRRTLLSPPHLAGAKPRPDRGRFGGRDGGRGQRGRHRHRQSGRGAALGRSDHRLDPARAVAVPGAGRPLAADQHVVRHHHRLRPQFAGIGHSRLGAPL